jgi:hypothetical protein
MKSNQLKKGNLTVNSSGVGTVTPKTVEKRAAELARIKGRSARNILESDVAEAQREITGDDAASKEQILESAPESQRWNPLPGSTGRKVEPVLEDDDDTEGRSDNERLVEHGVNEAEHDQMRKASKNRG